MYGLCKLMYLATSIVLGNYENQKSKQLIMSNKVKHYVYMELY